MGVGSVVDEEACCVGTCVKILFQKATGLIFLGSRKWRSLASLVKGSLVKEFVSIVAATSVEEFWETGNASASDRVGSIIEMPSKGVRPRSIGDKGGLSSYMGGGSLGEEGSSKGIRAGMKGPAPGLRGGETIVSRAVG